jgi:RNA polymerase sigma-70 factor (ECF subfamily)
MSDQPTAYLQHCLERWKAGDESARKDLLGAACARLTQLTRTMLRDYRRVRRWEETDDVLQNAVLRLHRALQSVTPPTLRDFYRLAALQIRRELIDLARHYYGPEGQGACHESVARPEESGDTTPRAFEAADSADGPSRLAAWSEFHQQVHALPAEEQEVFELVWYQGLPHTEAAALLNVSARTVKRRWQAACLRLHEALGGALPGL